MNRKEDQQGIRWPLPRVGPTLTLVRVLIIGFSWSRWQIVGSRPLFGFGGFKMANAGLATLGTLVYISLLSCVIVEGGRYRADYGNSDRATDSPTVGNPAKHTKWHGSSEYRRPQNPDRTRVRCLLLVEEA